MKVTILTKYHIGNLNYSRFIDCFEELMITFSDKLTHTCPKEKKTRVAVTFMWPLVPFHQYT